MKKIIVNIITLLIVICMAGCSYAEELQFKATIEISANVTEVSAGDKVTFTFVSRDIENSMLDGKVGGIEGLVTFDTNFFEYDSCSGFEYNASNNKLISFNFTAEGGTNGTFTLKVKEGAQGTATVTFSGLVASDGRETENADTLGTARTEDQAFTIALKVAQEPSTPPADEPTGGEEGKTEDVIPEQKPNDTTDTDKKQDNTTTGGSKLPQTGIGLGVTVGLIALVGIGAFTYLKYGKLRDIR